MPMRKIVLLLLLFVSSVGTIFVKADAVQTDLSIAPGIEMFVSTWSTDRAQVDIQFSNGFFQVEIETFDHGYEYNEWIYTCTYDEHKKALIASNTGIKNIYIYDFDTDCETQSVAYQNGSAIFTLDPEGYLMWFDENEHTDHGLIFEKMGNYDGIWQYENITIDFHAIGGTYRCTISMNEGNDLVTKWTYFCKYDLESGNAISDHLGRKEILIGYDEDEVYDEVYNDGYAIFSIIGDGYLLWNDLKENAGADFLFIKKEFVFVCD